MKAFYKQFGAIFELDDGTHAFARVSTRAGRELLNRYQAASWGRKLGQGFTSYSYVLCETNNKMYKMLTKSSLSCLGWNVAELFKDCCTKSMLEE